MMPDAIAIVLLAGLLFLGVLAYLVVQAPDGYEDLEGFHRGPKRGDEA